MASWMSHHLKVTNPLGREAMAEFLGTFILIVFGDGPNAQTVLSSGSFGSSFSIQWSNGVAVMMGIYVAGGVSGGHINPAVTVAQAVIGRIAWRKVPAYIAAQFCGSFCASVCIYIVYLDALHNFDNGTRMTEGPLRTAGIWATYPQSYVSIPETFADQIFGTTLLLICVLAITDERNMGPHTGLMPIAIGLIMVVIGMSYGLNCANALNPARDLAPRIFTTIAGWGEQPFSHRDFLYFWVPVVGPHLGAVLGCFVYLFFVGLHWPDLYEVSHEIREPLLSPTVKSQDGMRRKTKRNSE